MKDIIEVSNLGKRYILGQHLSTKNFREAIANRVRGIFSKDNSQESKRDFWALRDLSFSLCKGERLGIIGKNGAGKSTTLKLLSRITDPTEGRIVLRGRLSSLLEVGTGFHPELTGKENIYLNGAILGMTRSEITKKFDEIVDFAGVESFLSTPVKRYSSGMYVRLAFSVAAHMEPEILVVDEVLAVGDIEFQKKCLGKMNDVAKEGRTILFVSHNMAAINSLCSRVIVLDKGKAVFDGSVTDGIDTYISRNEQNSKNESLAKRKDRSGNQKARAVELVILDSKCRAVNELLSGEDYTFKLTIEKSVPGIIERVIISLDIYDLRDHRWILIRNDFQNCLLDLENDFNEILCKIQDLPLASGKYFFSIYLSIADKEILDFITHVCYFDVVGGDFYGTGSNGLPNNCKMLLRSRWIMGNKLSIFNKGGID